MTYQQRHYDVDFYNKQKFGSKSSAEVVVPFLVETFRPSSVVDFGCGAGVWLDEFRKLNVKDLLGLDGSAFDLVDRMVNNSEYMQADLSKDIRFDRRFDIALCLEVAEHIPSEASGNLVQSLTTSSDVVYFSAAIPFQGGVGHINEQWQSCWVDEFRKYDFVGIDFIRPKVWQNSAVKWWYAQNSLVFVSRNLYETELQNISDLEVGEKVPTDIVHPAKYLLDASPDSISVRRALNLLIHAVSNSIRRRWQGGAK